MFFLKKKKNRRLYLDTAAATPVDPRVLAEMAYWEQTGFGNPGSIHTEGVEAREAIIKARQDASRVFSGLPDEIIFTSGGTEGNNLAILGTALAYEMMTGRPGRFITSAIEHKSILEPAKIVSSRGWEVIILPVNREGLLKLDDVKESLTVDTALVSVGYVNNEIGTIMPLSDIARLIKKRRKTQGSPFPYFHADACQAPRFLPIIISELGVDLMTINSSKIYGPKGVGILYKSRTVELKPILYGGGQEGGRRSGTENVPAIIGMMAALRLCQQQRKIETNKITVLRDEFIQAIRRVIPEAMIHGSLDNRLANNINITLPGVLSEWAVIQLDSEGIAAATGSACASSRGDDRHVLVALYGDQVPTEGSIRLTLGRDVNKKDMERLLVVMKKIASVDQNQHCNN
jgi:cysteine desulfurase